jgi:penicillin amidase
MKTLKRVLFILFTIILIVIAAVYFWMQSTAPDYSGQVKLRGLQKKVDVVYDAYGVPHIYAQNARDAYFSLGYAHAQDRLFQMVMIRRVVEGRLSELLGPSLLKTDKYMRTLSISNKMAEASAKAFLENADEPIKEQVQAYLDGVNSFIKHGSLPIEFTLLNFKPEPFTVKDVFSTIGYMSLGFTSALKDDPLMSRILKKTGNDYLKDFSIDSLANAKLISGDHEGVLLAGLMKKVNSLQDLVPMPIWEGSNNWVISKEHSKSGKVMLANDTHIKYSQPSVWYEADIQYPGFNLYGYYLAGVPFALVGHNNTYAWGLTIFPFDNMDLYAERQNPDNPLQVWQVDHWQNMETVHQNIKVKGEKDVPFDIHYTRHGPLLNDVYENILDQDDRPVSLWWAPLHFNTTALEALYLISNATDMEQFKKAMPLIDVVGLNVVYGDKDGNIALWATGKIPRRPAHVNSRLVLDGTTGKDDVLGFYPFSKNPQWVNPPEGILNTSNNAPPPVDGVEYPGYYSPGYRSGRVTELLRSRAKWDLESMKSIQLDTHSARDIKLTKLLLKTLGQNISENPMLQSLANWDGNYDTASRAAVIYTQWLYFALRDALMDEIGEADFHKFVGTYLLKGSIEPLFENEQSPWWDNVKTKAKETRSDIFKRAFAETTVALNSQLGADMTSWKWGHVHQLIHVHPIGQKKPFDKYFNVGPFPMRGSNEVVDKEGFVYNEKGIYPVISGPALRFIIDFGDPQHALSIIPTGQSGNVLSAHYKDQAEMFVQGKYRTQITLRSELKNGKTLSLLPEK